MIATIQRISAVGLLALVAGGVVASGCSSETDEPPGGYSQPCGGGGNQTCAEGFTCVQGLCTVACSDVNFCTMYSPNAICDGYCFEACRDSFNCMPPLVCKMVASVQGTCRPQ